MGHSAERIAEKTSQFFICAGLVFFLIVSSAPAWAQEEEDPFAMPLAGEVKKQEQAEVPAEWESAAPLEAPSAAPEAQAPQAAPAEPNAPTALDALGTGVTVEGEIEAAPESQIPTVTVAEEPEAKPEVKPEETIEAKEPPKAAIPALKAPEDIMLLDDFNGGVRSNLLGGAMGTWSKDEYDDTQSCEIDFVEHPRLGKTGYSMQISYDVDSPNPAYNGVWIKLEGFDASPYKFLVLYLKAPNSSPYGTDRVKIEMRNSKKQAGAYLISRIPRGAWREYKIPLKKFSGLKDLSSLDELVIVFEDKTSNPKEGILYLESVYFTKGEIRRPE